MPRLSQLMIRTALLWLALGYTVGGVVLLNKGVPLLPWLWVLRTAHIHMLLVGWTVQFACGVAFWILPRLDARGARGNERLAWCCYAALNSAVLLGVLADPLAALDGGSFRILRMMLPTLMGLIYLLAAALFVTHAWPRVVSFRTIPRPTRDLH
ncbi:MAG: hypothetical protein ABIV47_08705 [Roseiflexaceae bacterium]